MDHLYSKSDVEDSVLTFFQDKFRAVSKEDDDIFFESYIEESNKLNFDWTNTFEDFIPLNNEWLQLSFSCVAEDDFVNKNHENQSFLFSKAPIQLEEERQFSNTVSTYVDINEKNLFYQLDANSNKSGQLVEKYDDESQEQVLNKSYQLTDDDFKKVFESESSNKEDTFNDKSNFFIFNDSMELNEDNIGSIDQSFLLEDLNCLDEDNLLQSLENLLDCNSLDLFLNETKLQTENDIYDEKLESCNIEDEEIDIINDDGQQCSLFDNVSTDNNDISQTLHHNSKKIYRHKTVHGLKKRISWTDNTDDVDCFDKSKRNKKDKCLKMTNNCSVKFEQSSAKEVRKREQNKLAATKYRNKKRQNEIDQQEHVHLLFLRNQELKRNIIKKQLQIAKIKELLFDSK